MSTERTIRPENLDSTVRSTDIGGTVRPASLDGTIRVTNTAAPSLGLDGTVRADNMYIQQEDINDNSFLLKGVKYRNLQCLSDNSGEAQVFLVEKDGEEYVLKIYYPNFNVNKNILRAVLNFDFEMIVRVFDYGKTYVDGKHRYYELMEYLRGGTLSEYKLGGDVDKFRRIALQGAAALAYCHECNILHKDIKPSNFFFRDKEHTELVLGDFGISSMLEKDGKAYKTTQARTPIYAAPEMYTDVIDGVVEISPAADFYLGMCLMALWLGGNPMSSNERVMMRQKSEGRLPHINELPERVRMIVQGLTVVNPINRWGYEQVEEWFEGGSPKVDLSSPFLKYKSFVVDPDKNLVADNIHELVPMLLENEKLAIGYLYNGKIGSWLESCGNEKLSTIVRDIVVNRYPVDQRAGLMSAIYMMEPTYPYKDVKGNLCDDVHSVAISLLSYQKEYGVLLSNPKDPLFLYLESHTKCDVDRIRSYFTSQNPKSIHVAIMRTVFEIDPEIPLMAKYPSSTIREIVKTFGRETLTEDDWHSLTDGRLLSWMYSHEDHMACESLRIMTQDQPYSSALAYKVLYNLDRESAYDLKGAFTPMQVGELLRERLKNAQYLSDKEFQDEMKDMTEIGGRFSYYAQLHGWTEMYNEHNRCFDFKSEENRERLGAYDVKTALYRFCRVLGVTPTYLMPDGTELVDGRSIDLLNNTSLFRNEIRNGSFAQWMAVFYHEDPFGEFSEEYAYEHTLEEWLMTLGKIDASQPYYKRFVNAREETSNRIKDVRDNWVRAKARESIWRTTFYALCGLWLLLVLIFGVKHTDYLLAHSFLCIGLPLGGMTAVIVGTRAYFRGYDFVFSCLWGMLGALSSFIPIIILKYMSQSHPGYFNLAIVVITLVYILVCHLTDFRGDQNADNKLITEVLDDDIKSTLLEPLYYTFKTKSYRFKGSKFGLLNDVTDQVRSISGESVLHYILWSLLALIFVIDFIVFSPSLMNVKNPGDITISASKIIKQLERDVE
ncbi:Serine/threonine protein kinase [Xylanibacter ruminicola]|uniref:non-specific serine/threonine protein kinase n=1 Tax=Xylanibacter ruminicola TaxID=839 RepID=A0A1H5WLA2_XYLRU|nr:protein kinase [Xylanibacter ruminicola]SEG00399.1 Serine/threonine protein kinase [Xylanibacter ruminicola]